MSRADMVPRRESICNEPGSAVEVTGKATQLLKDLEADVEEIMGGTVPVYRVTLDEALAMDERDDTYERGHRRRIRRARLVFWTAMVACFGLSIWLAIGLREYFAPLRAWLDSQR